MLKADTIGFDEPYIRPVATCACLENDDDHNMSVISEPSINAHPKALLLNVLFTFLLMSVLLGSGLIAMVNESEAASLKTLSKILCGFV